MADTNIGDFSTTAVSNSTVGGVNIAEGSSAAQLNDAIRATLAVVAGADFGTKTVKVDTIAEHTAAAGVTIDGLLIKDGGLPALTAIDLPSVVFADVGDVKATVRTTAPTGWLMFNGDSIGSAASGADQASDDYETLYALFWDGMADTEAPVAGGRGANAAADWAANKALTMPDARGRGIIGSGTGASLTARTHGATGGAESVALTEANLAAHDHSINTIIAAVSSGAGAFEIFRIVGGGGTADSHNTNNAGSGTAHNNMQPWLALNWIVKY